MATPELVPGLDPIRRRTLVVGQAAPVERSASEREYAPRCSDSIAPLRIVFRSPSVVYCMLPHTVRRDGLFAALEALNELLRHPSEAALHLDVRAYDLLPPFLAGALVTLALLARSRNRTFVLVVSRRLAHSRFFLRSIGPHLQWCYEGPATDR